MQTSVFLTTSCSSSIWVPMYPARCAMICVSACCLCSLHQCDWRAVHEMNVGYVCTGCRATARSISFTRFFNVPALNENLRSHVLWFLELSPASEHRRSTLRCILMGAPHTTCALRQTHLEIEKQLRNAWRGRWYRRSCTWPPNIDLYDVIISFLT